MSILIHDRVERVFRRIGGFMLKNTKNLGNFKTFGSASQLFNIREIAEI